MSSPSHGMNPYLENIEFWSEFHSHIIVAIADALDDCFCIKTLKFTNII